MYHGLGEGILTCEVFLIFNPVTERKTLKVTGYNLLINILEDCSCIFSVLHVAIKTNYMRNTKVHQV